MTDLYRLRILFPLAVAVVSQVEAAALPYLTSDRSQAALATALTRTIATEPLRPAEELIASAQAQAWLALARLQTLLEEAAR